MRGSIPNSHENPEAMKQAIQNAGNLNESQKQALQAGRRRPAGTRRRRFRG